MTSINYAIIPARSGSKGVPGKNVRLLAGHPLLAWSIAAARLSRRISRVIVSTDSEEYASIARSYGAEAPFLRPAALAGSHSPDRDFLRHATQWLLEQEGSVPHIWVHLRPTTPLRDPTLIDEAVDLLLAHPEASSLRSAHEASESPAKWFRLQEGNYFAGLMGDQWLNAPRQECPKGYVPDGYVDLLRVERILDENTDMYFPGMLAFVSPPCQEVDTPEDFAFLEYQASQGHPLLPHLAAFAGQGD